MLKGLTYTELLNMLARIDTETFGREFKGYLTSKEGVSEVRDVIEDFLQYYVRKRS